MEFNIGDEIIIDNLIRHLGDAGVSAGMSEYIGRKSFVTKKEPYAGNLIYIIKDIPFVWSGPWLKSVVVYKPYRKITVGGL